MDKTLSSIIQSSELYVLLDTHVQDHVLIMNTQPIHTRIEVVVGKGLNHRALDAGFDSEPRTDAFVGE